MRNFAAVFLLVSASAFAQGGKWKFETLHDQMDDSTRAVLSLPAEAEIDGKLPSLIVRCPEPKVKKDGWGRKHVVNSEAEVYVVTGWPVHGGASHKLRVRLDDQKPITDVWEDSQDLGAVFHQTITTKGQVEFLRRIATAKKMLFEFTPYMGTPKVAEFDVTGLDTFLPKLSEQCQWPK